MYLFGFFTGIGLSLLAKGLVGIVVPGGVTGLFFLLQRKWPAREYFTSLLWGAPVTALVAGTWYGPVISRHGWLFINEFFIQHHFARYVSDKYHHSEPAYYYLLVVWLLVLPWIAYVAGGLIDIVKQRFGSISPLAKLDVFAFAWIVFPIVFFSLSGSKLPGYILPVVPGAAILAARKLSTLEGSASSRWHVFLTSALLLSLAVGSFAGGNIASMCNACRGASGNRRNRCDFPGSPAGRHCYANMLCVGNCDRSCNSVRSSSRCRPAIDETSPGGGE